MIHTGMNRRSESIKAVLQLLHDRNPSHRTQISRQVDEPRYASPPQEVRSMISDGWHVPITQHNNNDLDNIAPDKHTLDSKSLRAKIREALMVAKEGAGNSGKAYVM